MPAPSPFPVPTLDDVSDANRAAFEGLRGALGFVPNLYATFAHSRTALGTYLALQGARSSITDRAREVVNLVMSQANDFAYCLAAHSALGRRLGFTDAGLLEIRGGRAAFDEKLDALARFVHATVAARGHPDPEAVDAFLAAGWTREHLVDTVMAIGDKTISNYLHGTTRVPVDFPAAPALA